MALAPNVAPAIQVPAVAAQWALAVVTGGPLGFCEPPGSSTAKGLTAYRVAAEEK